MVIKCVQGVLEAVKVNGIVLAGVSGGADSVCMMDALLACGADLRVVHVMHGIRGQEAERDAAFVQHLCAERNVPFYLETVDAPAYAAQNGISMETAARLLRYAAFDKVKKQCGARYVAVAHNLDDQAETVLLRLTRGSGLYGLCAMEQYRQDGLLRPLLGVSRAQIEDYCRQHSLEYVFDSTNAEQDCSRNLVRGSVMPLLRQINGAAAENIVRSSMLLRQDSEFMEQQADIAFAQCFDDGLDVQKLAVLPISISGRVLRRAVAKVDCLVDIELVHINAMLQLCKNQSGKAVQLPRGLVALRTGNKLLVQHGMPEASLAECTAVIGTTVMENATVTIERVQTMAERTPYCEYFTVPGIDGLTLRYRRAGDTIRPIGAPGERSLKKYFIDKKVPLQLRGRLPLLARGEEILVIPGYTVAQSVAVTGKDDIIYRITVVFNN